MAYYKIPLTAGVSHVQDAPGSLILVDGIDGAAGVDVTPIVNGSRQVTMPGRKAGFKYRTQYDAVELVAAADCEVRIFLTTNDVSLGFTDGAQVNVLGAVQVTNGVDKRLPVDLAGGTVTVNAANVGINNTNANPVPTRAAQGATIGHVSPVAVGTVAVSALAASATRYSGRFRNVSTNGGKIALGGAGVTMANAVIILDAGQLWIETEGAAAEWYAISDKAGSSLAVMGVAQ